MALSLAFDHVPLDQPNSLDGKACGGPDETLIGHPDGAAFFTTLEGLKKDVPPMKWSQLLNPPKGVGRLSLLAGYVAGKACPLYAIFIAHTMNPVSYRMVENDLDLRAMYGRYQEIYNLDGLAFTLITSFAVFAIALCAVRGIAWTIREGSLTP